MSQWLQGVLVSNGPTPRGYLSAGGPCNSSKSACQLAAITSSVPY